MSLCHTHHTTTILSTTPLWPQPATISAKGSGFCPVATGHWTEAESLAKYQSTIGVTLSEQKQSPVSPSYQNQYQNQNSNFIAKSKPKIHSKIKTQSTNLATHQSPLLSTLTPISSKPTPISTVVKTHNPPSSKPMPTHAHISHKPTPTKERDRETHNHQMREREREREREGHWRNHEVLGLKREESKE